MTRNEAWQYVSAAARNAARVAELERHGILANNLWEAIEVIERELNSESRDPRWSRD